MVLFPGINKSLWFVTAAKQAARQGEEEEEEEAHTWLCRLLTMIFVFLCLHLKDRIYSPVWSLNILTAVYYFSLQLGVQGSGLLDLSCLCSQNGAESIWLWAQGLFLEAFPLPIIGEGKNIINWIYRVRRRVERQPSQFFDIRLPAFPSHYTLPYSVCQALYWVGI